MKTTTITIERTPVTIQFDGKDIDVEELSIRLSFGRKPSDFTDIAGSGNDKVFVTETREMTPAEFDRFASALNKSHDWLKNKGGYFKDGRLCVEVVAPGRPSSSSIHQVATIRGMSHVWAEEPTTSLYFTPKRSVHRAVTTNRRFTCVPIKK